MKINKYNVQRFWFSIKVPVEYLIGVIVCNENAKQKVEDLNLNIQVIIRKELFFQ